MLRAIGAALAVAAAISGGACASRTGAVPRPFPTPDTVRTAAPPPDRSALVETALQLRGVPYLNGGSNPQGFDCSGFTQYVFAQFQMGLPRETRAQFKVGEKVRRDEIAAGDLLFFATTSSDVSHVAIAIGADEFVHAPSSTGVVRVEKLSSSYWSPRFLGARRVTPP